jgi:hypothetical protein
MARLLKSWQTFAGIQSSLTIQTPRMFLAARRRAIPPVIMKILIPLASCYILASSAVLAQQVFYTPTGLATESQVSGDPSIWNLTVTGGAIQTGDYTAWCFSMDLPGYAATDFGHNFESTVTSIDSLITNYASPGINKAGALVNYLFDAHYGSWNQPGLTGDEIRERIIGFHHILWEIQRDYNPEFGFSSFDLASGEHMVGANPTLDLISSDLSAAYSGLSESYTSGFYQLKAIDGSNVFKNGSPLGGSIQPLIVVSVIPEPSSLVMGGLAAGMLMLRRRRSK